MLCTEGDTVKKWILAFALAIAFVLPASAYKDITALKTEQHAAAVTIITQKDGTLLGSGCSASAIAPHVLITSAHCRVDEGKVYLNQTERPFNHPMIVGDRFYDGSDHMLLVLPDVTFKHFVKYDPDNFKAIKSLERYYFWGNPGMVPDQYREGYVTGFFTPPNDDEVMLSQRIAIVSGPSVGGDSGSAIFAEDGRIVGTLTWGIENGLFSGFYPLAFTKEQILQSEGLGPFVYHPEKHPVAVVNVAPSPVRVQVIISQNLFPSILILMGGIFLIMYSWSHIRRMMGYIYQIAQKICRIRITMV